MNKGFSLATLTATVTIVMILVSVIAVSGNKISNNRKVANFATEISAIQDAVNSYLVNNPNDYPILNSVSVNLSNVSSANRLQFTNNGDVISSNSINLYEIDYNKINYNNIKYGNKAAGDTDVYLLSAITSKVYYIKGFKTGNKVFYTLTDELKKYIDYQTSDTKLDATKEIISYEQVDIGNSQKKVIVNIPVSYTNPVVKVGTTTYTGRIVDNKKVYEVTALPGTIINITYTDNGIAKTTSYTIIPDKTEKSYVQDGLILHYDGINNTGNGHSSTTTTWKDLSGNNNDGTLTNFDGTSGWSDACLNLDGSNDYILTALKNLTSSHTFEIILKKPSITTSDEYIYNYSPSVDTVYNGLSLASDGNIRIMAHDTTWLSSYTVPYTNYLGKVSSFVTTSNKNDDSNFYINSDSVLSFKAKNATISGSGNLVIGDLRVDRNLRFRGQIYSFRVYNRSLTEAEIKKNYEVDKARFGIQ